MRILAFDTSSYVGTVAVVEDGELRAEWSALVRASHGETLLPYVERVLSVSGLSLSQIDVFAVGLGPGSFTGVRIGVATAKGFALAERKPLVGVPSLRVLARGVIAGEGVRVPIVDAHKGEVYTAAYELDAAGELCERVAPFHAPPAEAARTLREALGASRVAVCGSGLGRYPETLPAALGAATLRCPIFCDVPRASCLAHEAALAFAHRGPDDLARLEPLYLRPSDATLPRVRA